jgi:lipoate-protein ligase A
MFRNTDVPRFTDPLLKNDALFLHGALQENPWAYVYEQQTTEVVHGPSCIVEQEVNQAACARDNVRIVRRRGGGGTVVLSQGMAVIVVVMEVNVDAITQAYAIIHRACIRVLSGVFSVPISQSGVSDLACHEKKILGSSFYRGQRPARWYYQSSLMVNSDLSLLPRYLAHPPREPQYRNGRTHTDFCTTMQQQGFTGTASDVVALLCTNLAGCIDLEIEQLPNKTGLPGVY